MVDFEKINKKITVLKVVFIDVNLKNIPSSYGLYFFENVFGDSIKIISNKISLKICV